MTNGGNAGTPGDGTDTKDFIDALNSAKFRSFEDWRLPTIKVKNLFPRFILQPSSQGPGLPSWNYSHMRGHIKGHIHGTCKVGPRYPLFAVEGLKA